MFSIALYIYMFCHKNMSSAYLIVQGSLVNNNSNYQLIKFYVRRNRVTSCEFRLLVTVVYVQYLRRTTYNDLILLDIMSRNS